MKVRFDHFVVDRGARRLQRNGQTVHLTPKAFDLLCTLIEHQPNVVSKADLHERIWPHTAVTDASLNVLVREIRQVTGDDVSHQKFVRTVARVGYAFCGEAVDIDAPDSRPPSLHASTSPGLHASASPRLPAPQPPACWLLWHSRALPLSEGDNVIGRGAGCDVQVDDEAVSRRHAMLRIDNAAKRATIADLDSMNGTYRGRTRITSLSALADGDTIKLGTVALKVRLWSKGGESETTRVRRSK